MSLSHGLPDLSSLSGESARAPRSVPIASLLQLETPHAVVDWGRAQANAIRVASYAREHGLRVRPHIKTHKDPDVARLQIEAGAIGVTAATPREAEVMAEVTRDILVAYPPVDPGRIERLVSLPREVELKVALDSVDAVKRLGPAAALKNRTVGILVEVDLGGRRTGVGSTKELLEVALACEETPGTSFLGLLVHPGNLRQTILDPGSEPAWAGDSANERIEKALVEMDGRLHVYKSELEKLGLECKVVSGGNTPTLFSSHLMSSLTEVRPGTYIYSDRDVASQGVLTWADCAYSVLATVVSTAVKGQAVVDAGTKAIGKEPLVGLDGYGALLDRPEVTIRSMSEEHGILDLSRTDWRPEIGDRVRIVPNHVCVSVHLQDRIAFAVTGDLTVRSVAARGR